MKICPIFTYAMPTFSKFLQHQDLLELDGIKVSSIKRMMGIHFNTSSTFCIKLLGTTTLSEDLKRTHIFDCKVWEYYQMTQTGKLEKFQQGKFSLSPAFQTSKWKDANQKNRHLIIKYSYHGFHHLVCAHQSFHSANVNCTC